MSNMPVETLEARYPVRIEEYGYLPDSCGAGEHRGGVGLVRQYRLLAEEAILQPRSDRHKHKPYGLAGGGGASGNRNILNPNRNARELPSKVTMTMLRGDVIRPEQGGGGYGDPLLRAPERVARDIANGKISAAYARDRHGVVVTAASAIPDMAATLLLRAAMRRAAL
jgi:N-methylhydantoinase B